MVVVCGGALSVQGYVLWGLSMGRACGGCD